jgi:hypothetical protein
MSKTRAAQLFLCGAFVCAVPPLHAQDGPVAPDAVLSPDAVPNAPVLSPDQTTPPQILSPDAVPSDSASSPDAVRSDAVLFAGRAVPNDPARPH